MENNEQLVTETNNKEPKVVEVQDESGKVEYFIVNVVIEHNNENYAVMVNAEVIDEVATAKESSDVFIAKIIKENDEDKFIDLTEEEFNAVVEIIKNFQENNE